MPRNRKTIAIAEKDSVLKPYGEMLEAALGSLEKVATHLIGLAMEACD
ncbi:MAG: hypothetical protein MZV70_03190 [Desulfobacterales bacterium]|nr:hypothetical protein [Desulfobacterales bacterium]